MQTPKFLRNLLQSDNYWNKNSAEFAMANEILEKLFPGKMQMDATGRYVAPEYDMTYEQFLDAQKKFDNDIENAIQEAEDEEYEDNGFQYIDIRQFIEIAETIDVRVLMLDGDIETRQLVVYKLNIPESTNEYLEAVNKIWVWHSEDDERICDDCAAHDGEVFEDKDDIPEIPVHPNCRCWVEEQELDEKGKPISSKVYKGHKPGGPQGQTASEKIPTFDKPIDIKPGQYAKFNGKTLTIYQDGKVVMSWDAVSGKLGFQSPEYQNLKNKGTIPAGTYVARQSDLQFYKDIDRWDRMRSAVGGGTWRGGTDSWGNSRVWLEPAKETNTFGRGGFSIHGGAEPGSAGCIDLTDQIDDFTKWFENNKKDVILKVVY
ncbi:MAG: DUF2778 domain-containing protein [Alphaproteobacteria bacterium]|nr:DUF2778 domain-containing protein [Alphaproteobacteria bacterium]